VAFYISDTTPDAASQKAVPLTLAGTASSGAAFGELALLQDRPRAATVICEADSSLGVICKNDYDLIIGRYDQQILQTKVDFLRSLPIFKEWRRYNLAKLTYYMESEQFTKHKVVFKENEPATSVFIVKEGEFKLIKTLKTVDDGPLQKKKYKKAHIATLGVGELVGVAELIDKTPRVHACLCSSSSGVLYRIKAKVRLTQDFEARVMKSQSYPALADINRVKKTTYTARVESLKTMAFTKPTAQIKPEGSKPQKDLLPSRHMMREDSRREVGKKEDSRREESWRNLRRNRVKRKEISKSGDYIPHQLESFDRTMTNLHHQPDTLALIKLTQVVSPRRRPLKPPCNIHVKAIKERALSFHRSRGSLFNSKASLQSFSLKEDPSINLEFPGHIRSLSIFSPVAASTIPQSCSELKSLRSR
jgi:CRP-like cAMP-binding protein